jgi:hypothetical protein
MSQLSKVKYSRHQWKHKATQRGDRDRYRRKQIARISAARDRTTKALKATAERLQQIGAQLRQLSPRVSKTALREADAPEISQDAILTYPKRHVQAAHYLATPCCKPLRRAATACRGRRHRREPTADGGG